jgi:hypothetical protein
MIENEVDDASMGGIGSGGFATTFQLLKGVSASSLIDLSLATSGGISLADGAKVGTGSAVGTWDQEYVLFDHSNVRLIFYGGGTGSLFVKASNVLFKQLLEGATGDNVDNIGRAGNRINTVTVGTAVGYSDGTRFRTLINSTGLALVGSGGSAIATLNSTDGNIVHADQTLIQHTGTIALINKTGSATVAGKVYFCNNPGTAFSITSLVTTALTYLAASRPGWMVCVGGGVADGSTDIFVPLGNSCQIVDVYCDAAVTLGHTVNRSGANNGQGIDSTGTATTAGVTIGINIGGTTGGAGLVRVLTTPVWA